nr:uncharacterized protein LOC113709292 [Coffea arabica]
MSNHEMEVKKAKSSSEKRTEDRQELHDLPEDDDEIELEDSLDDDDGEDDDQKNTMFDQMDLSMTLILPLPLRTSAEKEDKSPGMMIRQKSESGKGLAISLPAGGSQKDATDQQVQDTGNVVKKQGNSTANSIMMPNLIRDVPPVDDLELHELQEGMAQLEEMKKKVTDPINQIRKSSADSSGDFNKDARTCNGELTRSFKSQPFFLTR